VRPTARAGRRADRVIFLNNACRQSARAARELVFAILVPDLLLIFF